MDTIQHPVQCALLIGNLGGKGIDYSVFSLELKKQGGVRHQLEKFPDVVGLFDSADEEWHSCECFSVFVCPEDRAAVLFGSLVSSVSQIYAATTRFLR